MSLFLSARISAEFLVALEAARNSAQRSSALDSSLVALVQRNTPEAAAENENDFVVQFHAESTTFLKLHAGWLAVLF